MNEKILLTADAGSLDGNCIRFDIPASLVEDGDVYIGVKGKNGNDISRYRLEYSTNHVDIIDVYSGKVVYSAKDGMISVAIGEKTVDFYCDMIYMNTCKVSNDMYIINEICPVYACIESAVKNADEMVSVTVN